MYHITQTQCNQNNHSRVEVYQINSKHPRIASKKEKYQEENSLCWNTKQDDKIK